MIFVEKNTKEKYELPVNGQDKEMRLKCPVCPESKRKNPKDLAVKGDVGFCHKCNSTFYKYIEVEKKEYVKPEWGNKTELSDKVVKWFENRKISQTTLKHMKITEGSTYMPQLSKEVNTIQFNYFQDGELVNVKYRDGAKNFKLYSGAKMILYNIDAIKESKKVIITEGEIDCLTFIDALIPYAVSVPNGANKAKQNLEYLDNCIDYFNDKDEIIIATDNDEAGMSLRNELLRRFGPARCKKIDFEGCKDANEYVVKYGKERLRNQVDKVEEFPIEGVVRVSDIREDVLNYFQNGLTTGVKLFHENLNSIVTWVTGRLAVVTGIPGMGKSEAVDEIIVQLNILHKWKAGIFSPENFPFEYHVGKIMEKITGNKFSREGMSGEIFSAACEYVDDNYFFIMPEDENYTLDKILACAQDLIYRHGIRIMVLDPWNRIEHQMDKGDNESRYVGKVLTKIQNFAQRNDVLFILVAHPTKMPKDASGKYVVPNLYDISGSANFFSQCDYGVSVHRRNKGVQGFEHIEIHVQKVRFKSWGEPGLATFMYNKTNGRFTPCEIDERQDAGIPVNYQHTYNNYLEPVEEQKDFWTDINTQTDAPF